MRHNDSFNDYIDTSVSATVRPSPDGKSELHHHDSFGSSIDYDESSYSPSKLSLLMQSGLRNQSLSVGGVTPNGGHGDFPCPDCGRMYKLKSSLRNHQKWECGKEPQFQCPFCAYKAKQKMHIGRHLERMHKDIVQMDCSKSAFLKEMFMTSNDVKKSGPKKKRRTPAMQAAAGNVFGHLAAGAGTEEVAEVELADQSLLMPIGPVKGEITIEEMKREHMK